MTRAGCSVQQGQHGKKEVVITWEADTFGNIGGADGEDWEQEVCCGRTAKEGKLFSQTRLGEWWQALMQYQMRAGRDSRRGKRCDQADKSAKSSADSFHTGWEGSCLFLERRSKHMSQQSGTQPGRVPVSPWISKNSVGSRCQYCSLLDLGTDV